MAFNFFRKKFLILIIIALWLAPFESFAFSFGAGAFVPGLPFGGWVTLTLPCTCSANLWIWFSPLSPSPPLPPTGPLVFQPGYTTLYGDYAIGIPATWETGSYVPIAGNGACWIDIGPACVPVPNLGLMNKVGTGLP